MIIITRKEAKVKGLIKYYTGKPCKHGHVVERRVAGGQCTECDKHERQRNGKKRSERYRSNNKKKNREYQREWYHNNKESAQASCKKYKENNKEKIKEKQKAWRDSHKEYYSQYAKVWWKNNKEKAKQYRTMDYHKLAKKKWYENNKGCKNYLTRKRQKQISIATPAWADQNIIKQIYIESSILQEHSGVEHHVDHIIPLQNDVVCGLHTPDNLRIVSKEKNLKKGNKYIID